MAKAGGITLDGVEFLNVTKRITVTPDLPTRMKIDGEAVDPVAGHGHPFEQAFGHDLFSQGKRPISI